MFGNRIKYHFFDDLSLKIYFLDMRSNYFEDITLSKICLILPKRTKANAQK